MSLTNRDPHNGGPSRYQRLDLPDTLGAPLCVLIPVGAGFAVHAAAHLLWLSIVAGVLAWAATAFVIAPLVVFGLLGRWWRWRYGYVPEDVAMRFENYGCTSLIFFLIVTLLLPVFLAARTKAQKRALEKRPPVAARLENGQRPTR